VSFSLGDEGVDTVEEALSQIALLVDAHRLSSAEVMLEVQTNKVILRDRHNQVSMRRGTEQLHALTIKLMAKNTKEKNKHGPKVFRALVVHAFIICNR